MRFTAQEEYGLRCILTLAREAAFAPPPGSPRAGDAEGGSLTVGQIAASEGLSVHYAGKLIRVLGKSGLVESARGRKGGYRLARPPGEITVSEILHALGGKVYEEGICERYPGDRGLCVHTNDCAIRSLWSGVQHLLDHVLSRTTLADLIAGEDSVDQWMHGQLVVLEDLGSLGGGGLSP